MEYVVGTALGLAIAVSARLIRFDRDDAFYPTLLIVIATYDILFAAMAGSNAVVAESALAVPFVALAVIGFRTRRWLVAVGLAAHGLFDLLHDRVVENPGVLPWWPGFCLTVDLVLAVALLLARRRSPRTD